MCVCVHNYTHVYVFPYVSPCFFISFVHVLA